MAGLMPAGGSVANITQRCSRDGASLAEAEAVRKTRSSASGQTGSTAIAESSAASNLGNQAAAKSMLFRTTHPPPAAAAMIAVSAAPSQAGPPPRDMVVSGRQPKESCLSNTSSTLCAGSPPASRSLASVRTVVATSTPPGESKKRIGAATSWADGHLSLFTPLGVIPLMPDAGRLPLREELPPTRCLAEAEELPRFGGEASLRSALVAAPLVGRPPASSTAAARSSGTGSVYFGPSS
mmetsp:Transcript_31202/g.95422  ORF Transcript_31202/g.95422 Transcript_31202/m.95422 type:complete len:238 (+) Transcript_31202:2242-2955(+)